MAREYQELMQLAADLALRASRAARDRFGRANAWLKDDKTWLTDADQAAQEMITDELARRCPDHAVLAEETVVQPSRHAAVNSAEFCWVIDPLDGTHNFVRHLPIFATSIAVLHQQRPVAAAVADAMSELVYKASAGGGAFAGQRKLAVRQQRSGRTGLLAIPSGRVRPTPPAILDRLNRQFTLRNLGSSTLHLSLVASGALDGAFCLDSAVWDVAAGVLLVVEAGGRVSDLAGNDHVRFDLCSAPRENTPYIAGSAAVVAELSEVIRTGLAGDGNEQGQCQSG